MRFRTKRRVVGGGLLVVAVWPLVHHAIVRGTELSPWKGAAWSMYCRPMRAVGVAVVMPAGVSSFQVSDLAEPHRSSVRKAMSDFQMRRAHLGRHARPGDLARAILAACPDIAEIRITVEQAVVDRATSISVSEGREDYDYARGDLER